jgi:hypothetical protein
MRLFEHSKSGQVNDRSKTYLANTFYGFNLDSASYDSTKNFFGMSLTSVDLDLRTAPKLSVGMYPVIKNPDTSALNPHALNRDAENLHLFVWQ